MREQALAERIWHGDDLISRSARVALLPAELVYRALVRAHGALYDLGIFRSFAPELPTISIGNLSVGGTGKTPVAAWIAGELAGRGAHPAIVMRGYGDDEPLVHRRLNPNVPVVAAPDRVAGIARAARQGADIAILDDGFQHRRVRRDADIVLLSADAWTPRHHLLPA
ncbi:MAG: tetraacyldisaccharide 4'-kinase, partial [Gemmatimonadota bacterium]|nr:tetraacyldisaccharide 4'-kinase [Gemmatimonadota bacterium]